MREKQPTGGGEEPGIIEGPGPSRRPLQRDKSSLQGQEARKPFDRSGPGEQWRINEGELDPQHVRMIARLLYVVMCAGVNNNVWSEVADEHEQDPNDLPAAVYVDAFAKRTGFDSALLHRWFHQASIEIAKEWLGFQTDLYKSSPRKEMRREKKWAERERSISSPKEVGSPIKRASDIAKRGIEAPLGHHRRLLEYRYAYYPDKNDTLHTGFFRILYEPILDGLKLKNERPKRDPQEG